MDKVIMPLAITAILLSVAGCRKKPEDLNALYEENFSPVFKEFDVVSLVEPKTIHSRDHQKQGSWNSATLRGNSKYSAVLPVTEKSKTPEMILRNIDSFIKSKTQKMTSEGDTIRNLKGTEKHLYTLFMYNWQNRHGKLHVWLFPYPDGKHIGFAAHLYEENLK